MTDEELLALAIAEARQGLAEGGIPIGAALAHDGQVLGGGHNRRVQLGSAIRHGETDCLENAGRLPASVYAARDDGDHAVAVRHVHRRDPALRDPAGGDRGEPNFYGGEDLLRSRGVEVVVLDDAECVAMMERLHRRQARAVERGHRRALLTHGPLRKACHHFSVRRGGAPPAGGTPGSPCPRSGP